MEQRNDEKLAWNISGNKIELISKLMDRGEMAIVEGFDINLRLRCWKSIALLIDNRLTKKQKNNLMILYRDIKKKSYIKNKFVNEQWVKGSRPWYYSKYIPNQKKLDYYINKYVEYVNYLLKVIGIDIATKDNTLQQIE